MINLLDTEGEATGLTRREREGGRNSKEGGRLKRPSCMWSKFHAASGKGSRCVRRLHGDECLTGEGFH